MYSKKLEHHYRPKSGWINDPNGLVWFKGYYHVFYQHAPHHEVPWKEYMHWGHARTKDFLHWEELPVALTPEHPYDSTGCWSGTAIVKDDTLFLFYASVRSEENSEFGAQTVSVAYSTDGIHFEKYAHNPVIAYYPTDGGPDFRDPAVCLVDGQYCCVMATGHPETKTGRLLLYKSENLLDWEYDGILCEWENCKFTECPSLVPVGNGKYLLTASVCPLDKVHYFSVMYGEFSDGKFRIEHAAEIDKGPDQYAGQVFRDHKGRNILISWLSGWKYQGYTDRDIGCMSAPRELVVQDGKILGLPVEEIRPLLKDTDESVRRTETGFVIERTGREPVVYNGEIRKLKILRDAYFVEVFVNDGETVFSALL